MYSWRGAATWNGGKSTRKLSEKADDDLAAAAAEAADGRPVYCRDRFYRALAGGQKEAQIIINFNIIILPCYFYLQDVNI
jgi:hypothetical protein